MCPLTEKGKKIKRAMMSETKGYGPEKGEEVFYKSERSGKLKGVVKKKPKKKK